MEPFSLDRLPPEAVARFKKAYERKHHRKITDEEAEEMANRVLRALWILERPRGIQDEAPLGTPLPSTAGSRQPQPKRSPPASVPQPKNTRAATRAVIRKEVRRAIKPLRAQVWALAKQLREPSR